jgi:hypothetical protein
MMNGAEARSSPEAPQRSMGPSPVRDYAMPDAMRAHSLASATGSFVVI